ncbi:MAG: PAS domain S-box protein [Bacteroidetes bacterium]|nr:PAS domain S-box protein [Bacteroidota bacterium]
MTKIKKTGTKQTDDLRQRAEKIAQGKAARIPESSDALSPEDVRQVLHELRVHQIELEMQNEELRRAQVELEASRLRYFDLYDLAPVGYCTLSEKALILEANITAATLLGVASGALVKQPITRFILKDDQDIFYLYRKQLFKTGSPQVCELRMKHPDDNPVWVRIEATAALAADGMPVCRAAMSDITERKQAEEALKESETHLKTVLDSTPSGIIVIDAETHMIVDANPVAAKMVGVPKEKIIGSVCHNYICPAEKGYCPITDLGQSVDHSERVLLNADGERIPILKTVTSVMLDGRKHLLESFVDITELKLAEEALPESHKQFQALTETTNDFVWEMDANGVYTYCSPQINELWGYKPEDMIGRTPFDLMIPEDREHAIKMFRTLSESPISFKGMETSNFDNAGRIVVLETSGVPFFDIDGRLRGYRGISRDITERKRAEEALQESEERFRTLYENSTIGLYRTTPEGSIHLANPALVRMLGYSSYDDLSTRNLEKNGFDPSYPRTQFIEIIEKDGEVKGLESAWKRKDGTIIFVRENARAIRDSQAKTLYYDGTVEDITERKRAEEMLRSSEVCYRTLFDESLDGICLADAETGLIIDCNQALAAIVGRERSELIGQSQTILHPPYNDKTATSPTFRQHLGDKEGHTLETQVVTSAGIIREVEIKANHLNLQGRKTLQGVFRDITERKRAEEALRKSEEKYRGLTENINLGIYRNTVGPEGKFIEANPAIIGMFGYKNKEEFLAINVSDLYQNPEDRNMFNDKMLKEGFVRGEELWLKKKDGSLFVGSVSAVAVKDNQGDVKYYDGIIDDITERKWAEEAIKAERQRLHDVLEAIPIMVCLLTPDYHVAFSNHAFRDKFGESYGRRCYEYCFGEKEPCDFCETYRVLKTAKPHHWQVTTLDGASVIDVYDFPFTDTDGSPLILEMDIDITERKRAEEELKQSEQRYRTIVETVPDVIYTLAADDGRFTSLNPAFETITGWSRDEWVGKTFATLVHPEDMQLATDTFQQVLRGEYPRPYELRILAKSGEYLIGEFTSMPQFKEGKIVGEFGIASDITERKRAEEEIRKLNAELEQRVRERTAQLEAANKELEAFSYSISHDLRAPLRAIDGFAHILQEENEPNLNSEGKRACSIIQESIGRMNLLIDDLLALSRLGRTEMQFTQINMDALVKSVYDELTKPEEVERIDFHIHPLCPAVGDNTLIRQVWINLLGNAIKFSSGRERAVIEVNSDDQGEEITYSIRDNGAGFDMQYADKLFGVFQRLHSAKEFEGTGIGLAIVQRIIHRHGGRIGAEGKVNGGATFWFSLPVGN